MAELTYAQTGLSRDLFAGGPDTSEKWPAGYRRVFERILVGQGEAMFKRLSDGILDWGIQREAGLRPQAYGGAVMGAEVVCGFGIGPFRLPVPCEVVWSEQGAKIAGFGYGTLPGHPAVGEEAFVAELRDNGEVWFSVLAFSRPTPGIFTLAAPLSQAMQKLVTRKYLTAARTLAS